MVGNIGYNNVSIKNYDYAPGTEVRWLRSIYWNNVPIVSSNNKYNFQDINVVYTCGHANGEVLNAFTPQITVSRSLGERLRGTEFDETGQPSFSKDFSKTYRILNPECKGIIVNVRIASLSKSDVNDDNEQYLADAIIEYPSDYRPLFSSVGRTPINYVRGKAVKIEGKIQYGFIQSDRVDFFYGRASDISKDLIGWEVRITRLTSDSLTTVVRNVTYIDSITEIYDHIFTYPNSAIVLSQFNAEYFSQVPRARAWMASDSTAFRGFARYGLATPEAVFAQYWADRDAIDRAVAGDPENKLSHPRYEFYAADDYALPSRERLAQNFDLLMRLRDRAPDGALPGAAAVSGPDSLLPALRAAEEEYLAACGRSLRGASPEVVMRHLERATELAPGNENLRARVFAQYWELGGRYFAAGNFEAAADLFRRGLRAHDGYAMGHVEYAPWAWIINTSVAAESARSPLLRQRAANELREINAVASQHAQRYAVAPLLRNEPVGVARLLELAAG